jgi:hypothetical protein
MRRIAAIVMGALVAAGLVAAPASAGTFPILGCSTNSGSDWGLFIHDDYDPSGDSHYTGTVDVVVTIGDETVYEDVLDVNDGQIGTWLEDVFYGDKIEQAHVTISDGVSTSSCDATYYPANTDFSGETNVNAGESVTLLVDPDAGLYMFNPLLARLEAWNGSAWTTLASANVTRYGGYALITYRPKQSQEVRLSIYDMDTSTPTYLGSGSSFWLNVNFSTPTYLAKSTSLVQSQTAKVTVAYGNLSTYGPATLQRYVSGTWQTVSSKELSSGVASFSWTPSATYKYRIVLRPWSAPSKITPTFTVTVKKAVEITKVKNTYLGSAQMAEFTVVYRLAKPATGKLQYLSGSTWKTSWSFPITETTTVIGKRIYNTTKWRVIVGTKTSTSVLVKKT